MASAARTGRWHEGPAEATVLTARPCGSHLRARASALLPGLNTTRIRAHIIHDFTAPAPPFRETSSAGIICCTMRRCAQPRRPRLSRTLLIRTSRSSGQWLRQAGRHPSRQRPRKSPDRLYDTHRVCPEEGMEGEMVLPEDAGARMCCKARLTDTSRPPEPPQHTPSPSPCSTYGQGFWGSRIREGIAKLGKLRHRHVRQNQRQRSSSARSARMKCQAALCGTAAKLGWG